MVVRLIFAAAQAAVGENPLANFERNSAILLGVSLRFIGAFALIINTAS